jgi:hypothetical protein
MNIAKIHKIKASRPIAVLDVVVIGAVLGMSLLLMLALFGTPGSSVEIWQDRRIVRTVKLDQAIDVELVVPEGKMTVRIEHGKVWVVDVNCPDQICKRMGVIGRVHQTIVCTPNNVFIRITGASDIDVVI